MKIFGSISRLVSILFRKNDQDITVRPNQATTYTAARDIQLPPGDAAHVLTSADSTQTLTNKTISGASNTISNVSLTAGVSGVLPVANGGTNSSAALNNNRLMSSSGGAVVEAAAITASRALASDANGIPVATATTATELGYVSGVTSAIQTQLGTKEATANKGVAGGYASLDGGGKVPVAQLPNSVMEFQGGWNATTNSPTLADGTGSAGDVYRVSTAGTQDLGSGSQTWAVGDWVMYSGTVWQKSPATDAVTSVNSLTGAVTLVTDNIAEDGSPVNLWFTDARARAAITVADSASVDLTYTGGQISAAVLPAGVDHNSLSNYDANKHIDHTAVSMSPASLGGLSGGGTIAATRSFTVDPTNATSASIANADTILFHDATDSTLKKTTVSDLSSLVGAGGQYKSNWVTADTATKAFTHGLGTADIMVEIFDVATGETIGIDSVVRTDTNTVTCTASEAPPATHWRVLVKSLA